MTHSNVCFFPTNSIFAITINGDGVFDQQKAVLCLVGCWLDLKHFVLFASLYKNRKKTSRKTSAVSCSASESGYTGVSGDSWFDGTARWFFFIQPVLPLMQRCRLAGD